MFLSQLLDTGHQIIVALGGTGRLGGHREPGQARVDEPQPRVGPPPPSEDEEDHRDGHEAPDDVGGVEITGVAGGYRPEDEAHQDGEADRGGHAQGQDVDAIVLLVQLAGSGEHPLDERDPRQHEDEEQAEHYPK